MKTKNEVLVEVSEDVRMQALWLFNLVPGVGNILFTGRRCFTPLMFFWLLIVMVAVPGFLKYLGLYFTLSLAGWNEILEERTENAILQSGDQRFTQAPSKTIVKQAKPDKRRISKEDFATENFQRKLRSIDFKPEPKPERVYSVPNQYMLPEQWPTKAEMPPAYAADVRTTPQTDVAATSGVTPATLVSTGPEYVFSITEPSYGVPSVVSTASAPSSTAVATSTPTETSPNPTACNNCGTSRDHGFSFCPNCARMFDM